MKRVVDRSKDFFKYFITHWKLIFELGKNDFKKRTAGSYLGKVWAFIQPMTTICVMWFVFSVGFKSPPVEGVPFIVWLSAGMIPWFFFSEALSTSTNSLIEYSFMLKQMSFRGSVLPIIKIISSSFIHFFLLVLLLIIYLLNGLKIDWYLLQVIYYYICMIYLILGMGWLFSSIRPFLSDIGEIIGVGIQLGFWFTPIFWNIELVPLKYQFILKLNPMFYIIQGYRDSVIYKIGVWHRPTTTIVFFLISTLILSMGILTFKKLRPHFNDVL